MIKLIYKKNNNFQLLYIIIITVCIILLTNNSAILAQSNNYSATSKDEQENINVYKVASPAVVSIKSQAGSGTGCIVDPAGIVVTNKHVIGYNNVVKICLTETSCYSANIIDVDNDDLALLRINANIKFPFIKLGDSSQIEVGQRVLAIGNPFGLEKTLTTGIISRIDYKLSRIQTDASINPGNSGGPLLNSRGELIGINQAIVNPSGRSSAGIGFAIPSNTVKRLLVLSQNARVVKNTPTYVPSNNKNNVKTSRTPIIYQNKTFLGITGEKTLDGKVVVSGIAKGSPAEKAGLLYLDTILSIDSTKIKDFDDIGFAIKDKKPGDRINLIYMRDGQVSNSSVILAPRN